VEGDALDAAAEPFCVRHPASSTIALLTITAAGPMDRARPSGIRYFLFIGGSSMKKSQ
jgi:hypothetical protein